MKSTKRTLAEKYHTLFSSSQDGIDVFEDLLTNLRLYETIDTEEDRCLHNFGIALVIKAGIYEESNMRMVTRNLLQIPLPPPRDNTEPGPHDIKRL
jgi:hypothetical protein